MKKSPPVVGWEQVPVMEHRKRKAAEEERRHRIFLIIANMQIKSHRKIELTYLNTHQAAAQEEQVTRTAELPAQTALYSEISYRQLRWRQLIPLSQHGLEYGWRPHPTLLRAPTTESQRRKRRKRSPPL